MNIFGIGPLLAGAGLLTGVAVVIICYVVGCPVFFSSPWREWLFGVGVVLLMVGICFWLASVIAFKQAWQTRCLARTGVYGLSRNPMYAGFILFIVPGLALMLNNLWLLAASVVMFVVFKLRIAEEEKQLRQEFGAEYEQYQATVPQLVPLLRLPGGKRKSAKGQ